MIAPRSSSARPSPSDKLRDAARRGDTGMVKVCLAYGTDINTKDKNGDTPLLMAVHYGHEDTVRLLIEKGADIETKDNSGNPPLYWAIYNDYPKIQEMLKDAATLRQQRVEEKARTEAAALEEELRASRALRKDMPMPKVIDIKKGPKLK